MLSPFLPRRFRAGVAAGAVLALLPARAAAADEAATRVVQLAPVTVKAGPLGAIGIRCSVDVGLLGSLFGSPHIKGMLIAEVLPGTAGQRAGLKAQDAITEIDGVAVKTYTVDGLRDAVTREKGDTLTLTILSPGAKATRRVTVTLGAAPPIPK